jgi:hypothetical protein
MPTPNIPPPPTITTRVYNVRFDLVPPEERPVLDKLPENLRKCYEEIVAAGGENFVRFVPSAASKDGGNLVMSGWLEQLPNVANGNKSITMKKTPFDVYNGNATEMFKKLSSPVNGGIVEAMIVRGPRLVIMSTEIEEFNRQKILAATVTASNRRARDNEMSL